MELQSEQRFRFLRSNLLARSLYLEEPEDVVHGIFLFSVARTCSLLRSRRVSRFVSSHTYRLGVADNPRSGYRYVSSCGNTDVSSYSCLHWHAGISSNTGVGLYAISEFFAGNVYLRILLSEDISQVPLP